MSHKGELPSIGETGGVSGEPVKSASRRDMLRRAALASGVVWSTPVIDSFANPAFAQGSACATHIAGTIGGTTP